MYVCVCVCGGGGVVVHYIPNPTVFLPQMDPQSLHVQVERVDAWILPPVLTSHNIGTLSCRSIGCLTHLATQTRSVTAVFASSGRQNACCAQL